MELKKMISCLNFPESNVAVELNNPDVMLSGVEFYIDQKIIRSDIIYVLFDPVLPYKYFKAKKTYTFLIFTVKKIEMIQDPDYFINFIVVKRPNCFTSVVNRINEILAEKYKLMEGTCGITDSFFHKHGIHSIFNAAYSVFQNPIILLDSSSKAIANAPANDSMLDCFSQSNIENFGQRFKELQYVLKDNLMPTMIKQAFSLYNMLASNIIVNGYIVGTMMLFEKDKLFDENDRNFFCALINVVTHELGSNHLYSQSHGRSSSLLLNDVINTPNYPPIMLERQLGSLGFNRLHNMCFVVISFSANPNYTVFNELTTLIDAYFPEDLYTIQSEKLILLITNASHLENKVLPRLKELHANYNLQIGISNAFTELSDVHKHLNQALTALSYYQKMTDPCYRYYVFYEHIAQLKLLDIMTAHCDLLEFCSPDIINLIKYDEKNQSDLAQTLSVYLNCFGDGILASRKLRIHKNTLYYRLGLIKNFMNNELTDGETNYVYMFSFRTLQYLGLFHPIDL
ncbi:hypothetical protein FRZ06_00360 [Anoxybacterium hadale]|uniref:Uncharacterized protein n=1 Tax=Anoxybacterium hadale TaxID=3408580 RepID=A0ACD1A6C8_9FIRM|nr:hypothetical protein FRZ06_00360 [Clostridiales bacterium]